MNHYFIRKGFYAHSFALFFEDFSRWITEHSQGMYEKNELTLQEEFDASKLQQEYDELFKGVNASIYIPLWASACNNNGNILLDETTLNVIKVYKQWGYVPKEMDGNPNDYIGEMFRFMEYISVSAISNHTMDCNSYMDAMRQFELLYLQNTIQAVVMGIKQYSEHSVFISLAKALSNYCAEYAESDIGDSEQIHWMEESLLETTEFKQLNMDTHQTAKYLGEDKIIYTSGRNNCGGKCIIKARTSLGCILQMGPTTNKNAPELRGCIRGTAYHSTYLDGKYRIRYPMMRVGRRGEGKFKRISWEEAAELTTKEWIRIRDTYGVSSRYVNYATGINAALRPNDLIKRLLSLDGGFLDKYNSYSSACARYITPYIYGDTYSGSSLDNVLHTKLLILWGHNPKETIFGSERNYYLSEAKKKGIKIIVIDPRKSDTVVSMADEWIGIRPSTDSALADGMAYVILAEKLQNQAFMDTFCLGFDEAHMPAGIPENQSYEAYLFGRQDSIRKTPEWAEKITGIPSHVIIQLAREYAMSKPACILPGLGLQRTANGEQATRSLAMLTCLTGNIGMQGGSAAGIGDIREHNKAAYPEIENPYAGTIPSFLWTKAIEEAPSMTKEKDGIEGVDQIDSSIKMLINLGGNTLINQHSDINNTKRILEDTSKCEFILCSDVFMTPSTKFADILIPATSFLEDENIANPWEYGSYLLYNNRIVDPLFESRFEYDFIKEIAKGLGLSHQWMNGCDSYQDCLSSIYESLRTKESELPEFASFKKAGSFFYRRSEPYIAYESQIKDFEHNKFLTPSGKIEIFSKRLYDRGNPMDIPAIPKYVSCHEGHEDPLISRFPLQLIGWHTKRRCHSIHDNNERMEKAVPQNIWIHPKDAKKRGIKDGDLVEVYNDRGRIRMPAHVTLRIIQGVTAVPQGAWYTPDKNGVDIRGSINVLTSARPTPIARGNPQHTNLVEVKSCFYSSFNRTEETKL